MVRLVATFPSPLAAARVARDLRVGLGLHLSVAAAGGGETRLSVTVPSTDMTIVQEVVAIHGGRLDGAASMVPGPSGPGAVDADRCDRPSGRRPSGHGPSAHPGARR